MQEVKTPYCRNCKEYFPQEFNHCPYCALILTNYLPERLQCWVIKTATVELYNSVVEELFPFNRPLKSIDFTGLGDRQVVYAGEHITTNPHEIFKLVYSPKWKRT